MARKPYHPSALQRLSEELRAGPPPLPPEARLEREALLLGQVPRIKGVGRIAIAFTPTPLPILGDSLHRAARFPGLPAFTFVTKAELGSRGIEPHHLIQTYRDSADYGHPIKAQARYDVHGRHDEGPGIVALRFENEGEARTMYAERDMTRAALGLPPAEEPIRMPALFITAVDPRADRKILKSLANVSVAVDVSPVRSVEAFLPTFE